MCIFLKFIKTHFIIHIDKMGFQFLTIYYLLHKSKLYLNNIRDKSVKI